MSIEEVKNINQLGSDKINIIVSGLERSGTSMMMRILDAAGITIAYDDERDPDENNPSGYYELFNGKIINKLSEDQVDLSLYDNKAIKITSFGLPLLPRNKPYLVIYMERDIDEIIMSTEKMTGKVIEDKESMKSSLIKLNSSIKKYINKHNIFNVIYIDYNNMLLNPEEEMRYLACHFDCFDEERALEVIDKNLYRNKKE